MIVVWIKYQSWTMQSHPAIAVKIRMEIEK